MISIYNLIDLAKMTYSSFIDIVNVFMHQVTVPFLGQVSIFYILLGGGLLVMLPILILKLFL